MKKFAVLFLVLILLLSACNTPVPEPQPVKTSQLFTDSSGRKIELPLEITRIAASGQMAQMFLFALCPDLLVGLAQPWTDEAEQYIQIEYYKLPILGQFYGVSTMNMEEIIKAAPQVIIDVGEAKPSIVEDMDTIMKQVNIPTVHIEATTETTADAYRLLGKLLNREDKAEELADFVEGTLEKVEKALSKTEKTSLLYLLGNNGLNVLAKTSFHAEVMDLVSENIAVIEQPSFKGSGNEVDFEQLLLWNPEVILFAPDSVYDQVEGDSTWQQLTAVANHRYYKIPGIPYNWVTNPPTVNIFLGMLWLTDLLYPSAVEYDLFEEVASYYRLFYGHELTQEEFSQLTHP
jgi:iron complex transport system substrate-binding protein